MCTYIHILSTTYLVDHKIEKSWTALKSTEMLEAMVSKTQSQSEKRKESAIDAFDQVLDSKFLTALAEPSRIEVLKQVIRFGNADITQLSEGLSLDRSVISRHLGILQEVGILTREKHGKHVYYQLNPNEAIRKFKLILNRIEDIVATCCPPQQMSEVPASKKKV